MFLKNDEIYRYNGINKIIVKDPSGAIQEIKLNIPVFPLSIYIYFILLGIGIFGLIINNSLIEKIQNDYPDQNNKLTETIKFLAKKKI